MQKSIKNLFFILLLACSSLVAGDQGNVPGMVAVHGGTLFWSVITFLLLLVVLKKIAWQPIIEALDDRENEIKNALNSAEKARKDAEKATNDYEQLMNKARLEAQQIIVDSKASADRVKQEIKKNAEKEAKSLLDNASSQIHLEKQKALEEIKAVVVDFSILAASKIIERNLNSEDNIKIINDTIDGIGKT